MWLQFIKNPNEEGVKEKMEENVILKQAMEELADLSDDPDFEDLAFRREMAIRDEMSFRAYAEEKGLQEGMEKGMKRGIQEGIKKGANQEKIKIAEEMIKHGLPVDNICKITQLDKRKVEELRNQIKKQK